MECSPFGKHNTRQLEIDSSKSKNKGKCPLCGGVSQKGNSKCFKCYFKDRKERMSKKTYELIGYDCWYCGYNKGFDGRSILEFHHLCSDKKLFNLSVRELVGYKWEKFLKR